MEETDPLSKTSCWTYCFSCLCKRDEVQIYSYQIQNEHLKAILQADHIILCLKCKETAQKAETFIQNVRNTQITLEKSLFISEKNIDRIKTLRQPITNLTQNPLSPMKLDGNNLDNSIVGSKNLAKTAHCKVKLEVESESEDNDDDYDEDNDDVTVFNENQHKIKLENIKKEREEVYIEVEVVKQEFEPENPAEPDDVEENIGVDNTREEDTREETTLRKKKSTTKSPPQKKAKIQTKETTAKEDSDIPEGKIKFVDLTLEECLQERSQRLLTESYTNSLYKCADCILGFNYKPSYEKHMETHSESSGNFECDICKQRIQTKNKLRLHRRYHMKRYKCFECGLTTSRRNNIEDHYRLDHLNSDELHVCPHCKKSFRRRKALKYHIANIHRSEKLKCDICNKEFAYKETLTKHMRWHSDGAGEMKRYVCNDCGMAFTAPSLLKIHSVKHSDKRDHYCVECDKSFKSDQVLKQHLALAKRHTNPQNLRFPCLECEQRFVTRRNLERHVNKVHLKIKPHQCDQCEKAYMDKRALKIHYRLIHEGVKPPLKYSCTICDKAFTTNQILKDHIRTHTGERPYQCNQCAATFSQAGVLRTHVKMVHLKLYRQKRPKTGYVESESTILDPTNEPNV